MNTTELRALAETLEHECALRLIAGGKNHEEAQACEQAADYLRACADNQPYETERWNVERQSDGSLLVCFNRHERGEKCEYEHFVPAPAAPQAEPKPLSAVDADYWARHRQAILDAIERAGFVLMSNANRFWLRPAPAAPKAEQQPVGTKLYTAPVPPQREPCIGNDPACPCQDGDACHYRDTATTKAWSIPQAKQERKPLSDKEMRSVLIAEARRIAVQAGETDPDSLTVNEEMLAQVMLAGRAVERAHGIGGSDAEQR